MPKKNSFVTVTDQFCGAGGSSLGAKSAGVEVKLALNHWNLAIETHNANFPDVDHDCTDVSACDPRRYPSTDILITSPECTSHSLAKGKARKYQAQLDLFGKVTIDPAEERSRATMWDVPRFAEFHNYNFVIVENVVDARNWRLFDAWIQAMQLLDYDHKIVYFNSQFAHPTPQSRDRMYVVFWKKGNKAPNLDIKPLAYCGDCGQDVESIQSWKNPNKRRWGRYQKQYVYRCPGCADEVMPYYYAAINCIDWSIQADRIGSRKRPLKEKTLARIQYGLEAYGKKPLIITGRYTSGIACRSKDAMVSPLPTQPGDSSHAFLSPFMVETGYSHSGVNRSGSSIDPLATQTTRQTVALVSPGFLSKQYGGDQKHHVMLDQPTGTVTAVDHHGLVQVTPGFMIKQRGVQGGNPGRHTVLLDRPTGTIVADDVHALVSTPSFIAELHGTSKAKGVDDPLMCVTAGGNHHALIQNEAFISYYYGQMQASGTHEALRTVTALDKAALVEFDASNIKVEDCTFRMLQPHEIGAAMAFPGDYIVLGNKRQKVRQYGNAVTPPVMKMLVERCLETLA